MTWKKKKQGLITFVFLSILFSMMISILSFWMVSSSEKEIEPKKKRILQGQKGTGRKKKREREREREKQREKGKQRKAGYVIGEYEQFHWFVIFSKH